MSAVENLQQLIDEIDVLIEKRVKSDSIEFKSWKKKVIHFLKKQYGANSSELKEFNEMRFAPLVIFFPKSLTDQDYIDNCKEDLIIC